MRIRCICHILVIEMSWKPLLRKREEKYREVCQSKPSVFIVFPVSKIIHKCFCDYSIIWRYRIRVRSVVAGQSCGQSTPCSRSFLPVPQAQRSQPDWSIRCGIKSFTLFVSRDAMNIDGLSEATLEKFIGKGFLHQYQDMFHLDRHKSEIVEMEGFGERTKAFPSSVCSDSSISSMIIWTSFRRFSNISSFFSSEILTEEQFMTEYLGMEP